jgi:hypothetical protein
MMGERCGMVSISFGARSAKQEAKAYACYGTIESNQRGRLSPGEEVTRA